MAGAGWKDFVPGEVLSAANVQDYLQDQSVMVFASAAARTSALASPSEGMVSYLKDTDTVERFDGSSWVVPFSVANGGTGATTVEAAQDSLRVGLVPISPVSVEKAGAGSTATANTLGQVTFSACQSLSLNGVFSAAYKNYRVMIRITDSSATNNTIAMRLRQISDNASTAYTQGVPLSNNSGTFTSLLGNGLQHWAIGQTGSVVRLTTSTIDIFNPFVSTFTTLNMNIIYHNDSAWAAGGGGAYHSENYSANGFSLIPGTAGSTIGGIVQVYGYNE